MALLINKQIGTDRGITKGAYVRIVNYTVSKHGYGRFDIELYMSEEDAKNGNQSNIARSMDIGYELTVELMDEVEETVTDIIEEQVPITEVRPIPGGKKGETETVTVGFKAVQTEIKRKVKTKKPSLVEVEAVGVFAYAYNKLKEKLVALYGANFILDK